MPDIRLSKLAEVLVHHSTKVKPGDWVHITAGRIAVPLVREVVREVLKAGGYPTTSLESDELEELFQAQASEKQLQWTSPLDMFLVQNIGLSVFIAAPENTRALSAIDPSRSVSLNAPIGEKRNPNARIFPFKVHTGKTPYDKVRKTMVIPKLFGPKGSGAYWAEFDWNKAIATGQEYNGLPYSGEYDFVATESASTVLAR